MPRIQKKKENKKPVIVEEVEPELEQETETEQAPKDDVKNDAYYYSQDKTPSTDEELEIPKKRTKQRSEKQLEQLRLAREKSMLNKEMRRKQKEEELNEWAIILSVCSFVLFIMFIGGYELMQFCQTGNRCGR